MATRFTSSGSWDSLFRVRRRESERERVCVSERERVCVSEKERVCVEEGTRQRECVCACVRVRGR